MPITTRTSIIRRSPGRYETGVVELDDPSQNEVTVKLAAAGLRHADDHAATSEIPMGIHPFAGGARRSRHDLRGRARHAWPPDRRSRAAAARRCRYADSFLPACDYCARGLPDLCDLGAALLTGARAQDPTSFRRHLDGHPVGQ